MLLTENALTAHDVARIVHLHDPDTATVHVLIPVDGSDASASADAQEHVEASIEALRRAGVEAVGEVTPADPVDAVAATVRAHSADEVVVVTEPHLVQDGLRRDWASRIRRELHLPVLHVVAGTDQVVS